MTNSRSAAQRLLDLSVEYATWETRDGARAQFPDLPAPRAKKEIVDEYAAILDSFGATAPNP